MQKLESLLAKRETPVMVEFDHLKHCVRCYVHIINICSSHVISSMTSVSRPYLSELKVSVDPNPNFRNDNDDNEFNDDSDNTDHNVDELVLDQCYNDAGDPELQEWFAGIKCNPLQRARRLIRLLRSSDQCKEGFRRFI